MPQSKVTHQYMRTCAEDVKAKTQTGKLSAKSALPIILPGTSSMYREMISATLFVVAEHFKSREPKAWQEPQLN